MITEELKDKYLLSPQFKAMVKQLYGSVRNNIIPLQDLKDAVTMVANEIENDERNIT